MNQPTLKDYARLRQTLAGIAQASFCKNPNCTEDDPMCDAQVAFVALKDTAETAPTQGYLAGLDLGTYLQFFLSPELNRILMKAIKDKDTWQEVSRDYWFLRLSEKVGELAGTLTGRHEHSIDHELTQIAAICLNFMRMLERTADD